MRVQPYPTATATTTLTNPRPYLLPLQENGEDEIEDM
eukprot:CAMPEP_0182578050 /NCGR_PEP_ID=MMETSP1324-20130603/39774_1 /TAXON_ID=236786 /ORGANISM="Florenciella sp., Strain RCC1587" /LENGTH=36 /DNA_ID= /DNA_START= /DNA_END= /DNA_ORIENTATION=